MKVGEARGIYSSVLKSYNQQKFKLSKQRNELKERMESTPDGKTLYADEAATLDLSEILRLILKTNRALRVLSFFIRVMKSETENTL